MATIFISYRRSDSASESGRIYDRLVERYGRANVFKDVDSIPPGVNFPDYIADSIQASDVALVVIGPRWLNASAGFAQRRLDDPADFVRVEIETALRLGVPVIPVLVGGASLPAARRLPESLRPLLKQNGVQVRQDPDFTHDLERIFAAVNYWSAQPRRPAPTPEPAPKPVSASSAPAPSLAPSLAPLPTASSRKPASATALAEQLGIAAKKTATTRWYVPLRLAPLLTLVVALVVIVGSVGMIANGTAERLFNPPNIPATQTASAQVATQQAIARTLHATETAQARIPETPYEPTSIGPCMTSDYVYTASYPYYWSWNPKADVACVSSGATLTNNADLFFEGRPGPNNGYPRAFDVLLTLTFPSGDTYDCAQVGAFFADEGGFAPHRLLQVCADGTWDDVNTGTYNPQTASFHLPLQVEVSVSAKAITFSVDGKQLISSPGHAGLFGVISVRMNGPSDASLTVTNFKLEPTA